MACPQPSAPHGNSAAFFERGIFIQHNLFQNSALRQRNDSAAFVFRTHDDIGKRILRSGSRINMQSGGESGTVVKALPFRRGFQLQTVVEFRSAAGKFVFSGHPEMSGGRRKFADSRFDPERLFEFSVRAVQFFGESDLDHTIFFSQSKQSDTGKIPVVLADIGSA